MRIIDIFHARVNTRSLIIDTRLSLNFPRIPTYFIFCLSPQDICTYVHLKLEVLNETPLFAAYSLQYARAYDTTSPFKDSNVSRKRARSRIKKKFGTFIQHRSYIRIGTRESYSYLIRITMAVKDREYCYAAT